MSYDNLSSVSQNVLKFYQQLTGEERRIPFIFDDFQFCRSRVMPVWTWKFDTIHRALCNHNSSHMLNEMFVKLSILQEI